MADWTNSQMTGTPDDSVKVLHKVSEQSGNAGAAGTTLLDSYTLPANTMGPNDSLRITTLWSCDNTANTKSAVMYFGDGASDMLSANLSNENSLHSIVMLHNNNSISAQKCFGKFQQEGMSFREYNVVNEAFTVDTSSDVVIGFQVEGVTATENIAIESVIIEIIRG